MKKKSFKGEKPIGRRATRGVAWLLVREGVSEALLFPASMLLARLLSPREFGIAAASSFFMQLAGRLGELGFNAAIIRAKTVEPIHLSTVFLVQLAMGIAMFAGMTLAAPLVGAFYGIPEPAKIIPISAIAFLISPFSGISSSLLQRRMDYKKTATVEWVHLSVLTITNVVLAWLGFSYMSIVYGRLAGQFSGCLMRNYFVRWRPSLRFSRQALFEILPSGTGFFAKRLLDFSAQNGDNLVVGKVLGMTSLGLYDKAYSTMNRFLVRMNMGGPGVMFRAFAAIHEEPERLRRAYQKVMMSAALLALPVFSVLGVMAPQVIEVLFGAQWMPAAAPFSLLCAAGALKLLNSYAGAATQAAGLIWSEVWRQIVYIGLILGGVVVCSGWGPMGAAFAVLCATFTMSILMHVLLRRVTGFRWSEIFSPLVPALTCAAGSVAAVLTVELAIRAVVARPNPWLLVACQVPVAGAVVLLYTLFSRHPGLRALVLELSDSLVPERVRRHRWAQSYLSWISVKPAESA